MMLRTDGDSSRRARPLAPDARRAALVNATLPLIRKYGLDISTRQIAAAAGVAEGTIFRVFPGKDRLIQATIDAAFDPAPVVAALERVAATAPLPERLTATVRIVQAWLTSSITLMMMLRETRAFSDKPHLRRPRPSEILGVAITRLIEPDCGRLRVPAAQVARLLLLLLFSGSHPVIADGRPLTPEEIVDVILDGVREHPMVSPTGHRPC